jgi:hypothetical protein
MGVTDEEVAGITGSIAAAVLMLVKLAPAIGRDHLVKLSLLLMACTVTVAECIAAEERARDERSRRLAVATELVFTETYETTNRKRAGLS